MAERKCGLEIRMYTTKRRNRDKLDRKFKFWFRFGKSYSKLKIDVTIFFCLYLDLEMTFFEQRKKQKMVGIHEKWFQIQEALINFLLIKCTPLNQCSCQTEFFFPSNRR